MYRLLSYIRFWWRSTDAYGVHSPFVYELVTRCLREKTAYPEYQRLDAFRQSLLDDDGEIEMTDFGAGSRVFKSDRRKVNAIAKHAGMSRKRARLLFRLLRYFQPESILEIGTSVGLATSALSLGHREGKVTTLEGCPQTAAVARNRFERSGMDNIEVQVGEFSALLASDLLTSHHRLIFFDGNHTQEATLSYFEILLPHVQDDDIWIFDDIHWSEGMQAAWETIKAHPAVTVTIDTWQWGLVFFRSGQEKEHFVVRVC